MSDPELAAGIDPKAMLAEPSGPGGGAPEDPYRSLGIGTAIMIGSTIALFLFNFVGRLAAARALTVDQFGEFNLAVSFTSLLSVLILLGLNQSVARALAYEHDPAEQRAVVRWSLAVSAVVSVAGSILVFLLAPEFAGIFHNPDLVFVFELLAISVGFGAITPVLGAVFQGFRNVLPNALFNQIVNPALFVVFVLLFLREGLGLDGALLAYVIADAAGFVGVLAYYFWRRDRYLSPSGPMHPRPNPRLWHLAVALWGVASLSFITAYADTLILGVYWPAIQVGYYSTAMTLARVVLLGGSALTFIFLPVAARLVRQRAYPALRDAYITATRWIMVLTVPLFLLLAFVPDATVDELFGARYGPASSALAFLALTAFLSTIVGPANACLAGLGEPRMQMWTALSAAAVNVVLSFSLIPTYGFLGAAVAWGVARVLYPVMGLLILNRRIGITPWKGILLRPLVFTLGIAIPFFVVLNFVEWPHWLIFPMFFGLAGLFLVSLLATRSLARGDLEVVNLLESWLHRKLPRLREFLGRFIREPAVPA